MDTLCTPLVALTAMVTFLLLVAAVIIGSIVLGNWLGRQVDSYIGKGG